MSTLAMPGILEAISGRRSVRNFAWTPIERSVVQTLLDAAVHAPTAMHEEPWLFAVVQDRDALKRLSDVARQYLLTTMAPHGSLHVSEHAHPSAFEQELARPDFNLFYNAGTLIVVGVKPLGPFVIADAWLATQNIMLAAFGLGLGSCCIGSAVPGLNLPATKRDLGFPADAQIVAAVVVGHPADEPREKPVRVPRKAPAVVSWT